MALPASGQITMNQVNVELGNSGTAQIGMNDADVRGLFGIASGEIEMADGYGQSNVAWYGSRALSAGGYGGARINTIDYLTIANTGNATDFGDLYAAVTGPAGCSDGSRGLFAGGRGPATSTWTSDIAYVDCDTAGNTTDFGDLTQARASGGAVSDGSRGVFFAGQRASTYGTLTNVIDYVTIANTGNATDFGDATVARVFPAGMSNGSRGVFAGGESVYNIDYITIATAGNAIDFGDLTVTDAPAGFSGGDRGVFGGEYGNIASIRYVDITTTSNASFFGNLSAARGYMSAASNDSRGVFMGGLGVSVSRTNIADYVTISTTGNATDFGDMTVGANSRGGLGGGS